MKHLSYETLLNLKDMLTKQINKEKTAVTLFNLNNVKLLKLQNDLILTKEAFKKKTEQNAKTLKESVTI